MITGLHNITIIASSEASVSFYEKLGFREFFRKERRYDTVVLLSGHGIQLVIYIAPNHPKRASAPEALGLRNFSLKVDSIEKTIEQLGLEAGPIINDWIGVRYCFIGDPDGLQVQLHE